MSFPWYTVRFSLSETAVIPPEPQEAGHTGDHGAVRLHITLPESVTAAMRYRLEVCTGDGAFDATELLEADDGALVYDIPAAWTAAGNASVQAVAVTVDADGNETARWHSAPMRLHFLPCEEGEPLDGELTPRWQELICRAETAATTMEQHIADGDFTATVAVGTVSTGVAGSQATVTDSGTPQHAVLNFTLPRGDKGEPGSDATVTAATVRAAGATMGVSIGDTPLSPAADGSVTVPVGSSSTLGAVCAGDGLAADDGVLSVQAASADLITNRRSDDEPYGTDKYYDPITPSVLDHAVKAALCDGEGGSWNSEEQAAARSRMDIPSYADVGMKESLVNKVTDLTVDSDTLYPSVSAVNAALAGKAEAPVLVFEGEVSDLPPQSLTQSVVWDVPDLLAYRRLTVEIATQATADSANGTANGYLYFKDEADEKQLFTLGPNSLSKSEKKYSLLSMPVGETLMGGAVARQSVTAGSAVNIGTSGTNLVSTINSSGTRRTAVKLELRTNTTGNYFESAKVKIWGEK